MEGGVNSEKTGKKGSCHCRGSHHSHCRCGFGACFQQNFPLLRSPQPPAQLDLYFAHDRMGLLRALKNHSAADAALSFRNFRAHCFLARYPNCEVSFCFRRHRSTLSLVPLLSSAALYSADSRFCCPFARKKRKFPSAASYQAAVYSIVFAALSCSFKRYSSVCFFFS